MFSKRHEQELAEIRGLTHDLTRRFQEILDRLQSIEEAQGRLLARGAEPPAPTEGPAELVVAAGDERAERAPTKRERRMEAAAAVAAAAPESARHPSGGGANGEDAGKRGRKKRRGGDASGNPSVDEE